MIRIVAFSVLALLSLGAQADGLASKSEAKAFSDRLVQFFVKEEFKAGFDAAKPHWPIPAIEVDGVVNQIDQAWPLVQNRFGKSLEIEYLKSREIGKSFIKHYYLHKFENHAIYWSISFYRPKDVWVVNHIVFLDDLEGLYE